MITTKYEDLCRNIADLGSVAVAFSGGVDSTFLLKAAHDILGNKAIAVTARSLSFPKRELEEASAFAAENGIEHIIVDSEELDIEGFSQNPPNRCYLCKTELFTKIKAIAREKNIENVAEGSNADDDGDYRPGLLAVSELGIKKPAAPGKTHQGRDPTIVERHGLAHLEQAVLRLSFLPLSLRRAHNAAEAEHDRFGGTIPARSGLPSGAGALSREPRTY